MWPQLQYRKVHGIIIDPYHRVGVMKNEVQDEWHASVTRALIVDPPEKILKNSLTSMIHVKPSNFKIKTLWDITIDECDYSLNVIELVQGFKLSIPNRLKLMFLSIEQISEEMLDQSRQYTNDSVVVFSHLTRYVDKTGIGTYAFKEIQ